MHKERGACDDFWNNNEMDYTVIYVRQNIKQEIEMVVLKICQYIDFFQKLAKVTT